MTDSRSDERAPRPQHTAGRRILKNPLLALLLSLLFAGIAVSGRFSVPAARVSFAAGWLVTLVFVWEVTSSHSSRAAGFLTATAVLLAVMYWARPASVPRYSGVLASNRSGTVLLSPDTGLPVIEM